jgi:exopolysaccharide production protein ExoZ
MKTLVNIQALRGLAALWVVMFHSLSHFTAMGLSGVVFESIAHYGFVGVDVFFVISGYVMAKTTHHVERNTGTGVNFLAKRFARIYLGYWPILFLVALVYLVYQPQELYSKELLQSFFLVNVNMFDLVIAPSWSLTFVLYFYALVAILMIFGVNRPVPVFTLILVFVAIKINVTNLGENAGLDFFFSPLLFEFVAGYFIFVFWSYLSDKRWLPVCLVIVVAGFLAGTNLDHTYGFMRVAAFGVFAASLIWLALLLEEHGIILLKGLLRKIGDFSYTLYLTHTTLLGLFYWSGLETWFVSADWALGGFAACLLAIIVFSWIFYQWVEAPLYYAVKSRLKITKVK